MGEDAKVAAGCGGVGAAAGVAATVCCVVVLCIGAAVEAEWSQVAARFAVPIEQDPTVPELAAFDFQP